MGLWLRVLEPEPVFVDVIEKFEVETFCPQPEICPQSRSTHLKLLFDVLFDANCLTERFGTLECAFEGRQGEVFHSRVNVSKILRCV